MSSKTRTESHFSVVPNAEIQKSRFDRSCGVKTTFNAGDLIPVLVDEVLPGDEFHLTPSFFGRLSTPIVPFMDNLYLDYHVFFVPTRLVWDNWEKFNGAQENPGDSTDYIVPTMVSPAVTGYLNNTIYDHFGIPTNVPNLEHTCLPLRGYNLIWNEWYRDENLQNSLIIDKGDGPDLPSTYAINTRGKRKDYFTSGLPWPQKGPAVNLPLGTTAPILYDTPFAGGAGIADKYMVARSGAPSTFAYGNTPGTMVGDIPPSTQVNLQADLTDATAATINELRLAFQVQKMYERDARGGTRYIEVLKAHFNVTSPDFRLQRPEYLGGGTKNINATPVPQTSATDSETPQGNLAAYVTVSGGGGTVKHSFTEHGYMYVLVSLRADLNYQQGLNRMWSRKTRFDYYWPALSHLGEQAILNKEIYAQGNLVTNSNGIVDDQVFAYQERHAEYRYKPNEIHGSFRSDAPASLDIWHFAQEFENLPTLNSAFVIENPPIKRALAVQTEPDLLLDCHFKYICTRPMPTYAVPGLVDHF